MARLPIPGGDDGVWGDILNNFLRIAHNSDGTIKNISIEKGGTGATTIEGARANLGITSGAGSNVFIQSTNPGTKSPHLWIQTGLGPHGSDMTFWVEDGQH